MLLARLKFPKNKYNFKVRVTGSKLLVSTERSCLIKQAKCGGNGIVINSAFGLGQKFPRAWALGITPLKKNISVLFTNRGMSQENLGYLIL